MEGETTDAVHVCVRIRPFVAKEIDVDATSCVHVPPADENQLIVGKDRAFTFDHVFDTDTEQQYLYDTAARHLVTGFFQGYNATVFAYGQTGSGKTWSMNGNEAVQVERGIIPRVVADIFQSVAEFEEQAEIVLRVEYLEIYNEELRDLLHPETPSKQLSIREGSNGNIYVSGVTGEMVLEEQDVYRLLAMGNACRSTGSTNMNEHSSRSHAIFSFSLQRRDENGSVTKSKFHLVDLAGSERAKRTGAIGQRFKESVNINQGLFALGNVISALGDEKRKRSHIPYRDSKLTRMLQDSLGGNSKTVMIACISPSATNFEETLNTLKYANRAKNIKNRPTVNLVNENEAARLRDEMNMLRLELERARNEVVVTPAVPDNQISDEERDELQQKIEALELQLVEHTTEKSNIMNAFNDLKSHVHRASTALLELENDKTIARSIRMQLSDIFGILKRSTQVLDLVRTSQVDSEAVNLGRHESEIKYLREQLEEAQDDLKRDEEIFSEKNQEIVRIKELLVDAKDTNKTLLQRVNELERGQGWVQPEEIATIPEDDRDISAQFQTILPPDEEDDDVMLKSMDLSTETEPMIHQSKEEDIAEAIRELEMEKQREIEQLKAEHEERTKSLENSARELEVNIRMKQELIRTMVKNEREKEKMIEEYKRNLHEMEERITLAQGQLEAAEKAAEEHDQLKHERDDVIEQWNRDRKIFESRIRKAQEQLSKLNQEKKDSQQLMEIKEKNEKKVDCLKEEICRMRSEKDAISKTLDKDHRKYTLELQCRQREINDHVREAEILRRKVRELEQRTERQNRLLQKQGQSTTPKMRRRVKSAGPTRSNTSLSSRCKSAGPRRLSDVQPTESDAKECIKTFGQMLNDAIGAKHASGRLSRALNQKKQLKTIQKQVEEQKKSLEGEKLRLSVNFSKDVSLDDEERLPVRLRQDLEDIRNQSEALDAEIDFNQTEIETNREHINETYVNSNIDVVAKQVVGNFEALTKRQHEALLEQCFKDLFVLRLQEKESSAELKKLEAELREKTDTTRRMESGMQASQIEFDRRLTSQKQDHEMELAAIMKKMQQDVGPSVAKEELLRPSTSGGSDHMTSSEKEKLMHRFVHDDKHLNTLVKHIRYYKTKTKLLQQQIDNLVAISTTDNNDRIESDEATQHHHIKQLEHTNDRLLKELVNIKSFLKSSGASNQLPTTARVPKHRLREVVKPQ